MGNLIVLDGDDTLWRVENLYDEARDRAAAIAAEGGVDLEYWASLQKEIDIANVSKYGLSRSRFPHSSVLAYERGAAELGLPVDECIRERIRAASAEVFTRSASLMPSAAEVVAELSKKHRLALLTQGDFEVQNRRIAESGLSADFEIVRVVERKDAAAFSELLIEVDVAPHDAWSIGNSYPSDIDPALRIGMSAIWIETHVWAHERRPVPHTMGRLLVCDSLNQVPVTIAEHFVFGQ